MPDYPEYEKLYKDFIYDKRLSMDRLYNEDKGEHFLFLTHLLFVDVMDGSWVSIFVWEKL